MMQKECVFMVYKSYYDSPVGRLELVSDGVSLTAVLFENQQDDGTREENTSLAIFKEATQWLDAYFKGDNPEITIPLNTHSSCIILRKIESKSLLKKLLFINITSKFLN